MHPSTVSRVLNGDPAQSVRPEIYQQILHRPAAGVPAQRARPRAEAAQDRRVRVRDPAAAQSDLGPGCSAARCSSAAERGYVVMIMEEPTDDPKPPGCYRYLVDESRADGLLIATSLRVGEHAGGVPIAPHVYVNRRGPHRGNNVVMDEPGAVRLFIEHVDGLGHRSIAIVDGSAAVDTVHRRVSAARRICAARGIRLTVLHAAATEEGGWDAAREAAQRRRQADRLRGRQPQPAIRRDGGAARGRRRGSAGDVAGELRRRRVPGLPRGAGQQRRHAARRAWQRGRGRADHAGGGRLRARRARPRADAPDPPRLGRPAARCRRPAAAAS